MDNHILSRDKFPLTNTAVRRGRATGNTVTSSRKGFALIITSGTILHISFVNCVSRSVRIRKRSAFRVALERSVVRLSGIVIATLNVRGGRGSLSCTASLVGGRRLAQMGVPGLVASLANGSTNIHIGRISSNLKTSTGIDVHKVHSITDSGRPLCIVSNIPVLGSASRRTCSTVNKATGTNGHSKKSNVSGLGPRSVRDVDVLGKTPTTTLCNDRTTGKIVLVAAGGKRSRKRHDISFSADLVFSGTFTLPGVRGHCKMDSNMSD